MSVDLAEFHQLVEDEANEPDVLDARIVVAARQAGRYIEENYTIKYMRPGPSLAWAIGDSQKTDTDYTDVTGQSIKKPGRIILTEVNSDGQIIPVETQPKFVRRASSAAVVDYSTSQRGVPAQWWLSPSDGTSPWTIVMDRQVDKAYTVHLDWEWFSVWPTATGDSPWLVVHAESALLCRTLLFLSPFVRDQELLAFHASMFESSIKSLVSSQVEFDASEDEDIRMEVVSTT